MAALAREPAPAAAQLHTWGADEVRPYLHALVPPSAVSDRLRVGAGAGVEVARINRRGMAWLVDLSRSDVAEAGAPGATMGVWAATAGVEQRWHRPATAAWDLLLSAGAGAGVSWNAHPGRGTRGGPIGFAGAGGGITNGRVGAHLRVQGIAADWDALAGAPAESRVRVGFRVLGGVALQL